MTSIVLTQYGGKIIGPIAKLIGFIIDFLFNALNSAFGVQNIGITIILFTIVVYILLFPITYKQQKFSKLQSKMSPELKKVQKKYAGKTDNNSRLAMNEETQAIYDKYGVSPTGSCLPLLIQFPILLAVYRVVYNVPAYVSSVREAYVPLIEKIMGVSGYQDVLGKLVKELNITSVSLNLSGTKNEAVNSIIDVMYKFTDKGWEALSGKFPDLSDGINVVEGVVHRFNYFLGLDISSSPRETIVSSFQNGQYVLLVLAVLFPIVSGLTQWLNLKLSTSAQGDALDDNPMAKQMRTMNIFMPLFSIVMVFTLPMGLGLYWIIGAVVRSVQQFFLNKHFDKLDYDKIIEDNRERALRRKEKRDGYTQRAISQNGKLSTRNIQSTQVDEDPVKESNSYKANAKPGSMASKANMVTDYNNRNSNK